MKKAFFLIAMIGAISIALLSCSKVGGGTGEADDLNEIDNSDGVLPEITVTRPSAGQAYVSGDSIIVEGKVTDDKKMYKGKVQITNDANGFMVAENFYETHFLQAINFRLAYKAVVTTPTDFSVLLEFQDHGANTSTATLKVKVNP